MSNIQFGLEADRHDGIGRADDRAPDTKGSAEKLAASYNGAGPAVFVLGQSRKFSLCQARSRPESRAMDAEQGRGGEAELLDEQPMRADRQGETCHGDGIVGRTLPEVLGRAEYERSRVWFERAMAGESVDFEKEYGGRH